MTALGLGTDLDPANIRISHHALVRYCERRGHKPDYDHLLWADESLRYMLAQATGQRPPVFVSQTHNTPSRRYTAGGYSLIVSADHSTLITMYRQLDTPKKRAKAKRRHRR